MKTCVLVFALLFASFVHAQDLQITDVVQFVPQAPGIPQGPNSGESLDFSASFTYDLSTGAISNMTLNQSDPFGLGTFSAPVSNNGNSAFFNFTNPNGDIIQIGNEYGESNGITFPQPGVYSALDTVLICPTREDCGIFNGGYIAGMYGSMTVTAVTPEPSVWVLLFSGSVLWGLLEALRRWLGR